MKRLFVGGLGHSVTEKDLKDRFGKFGKVEDVELKTRTDTQGVPFKTFGYINITISDAELKKCQSVLNKSQWKGGTLQIETAKESFLQRLSQEREDLAQHSLDSPKASPQQQVLDSLKDAGVSNFTLKSAVPGTEIPGHKDWVVGKFGRVLPVLQMKHRHGDKVRTLKYDPSKHGHNLRVLAPPPSLEDTPTPVSQLTWTLEGGDDDISRKRRGEFPPFTPKKKKDRPSSDLIGSSNGSRRPVSDNESDEELRRVKPPPHNALGPEEDALEVVSLDFTNNRTKDQDDCDSADTDELFSSRKTQTISNKMAPDKRQNGRRSGSKHKSTDREEEEDSGKKKKKVQKTKKAAKTKRSEETKQGSEETKQGSEETKQGSEERSEETKQGSEETKQGSEETKQGSEETKQGGEERSEETDEGDAEEDSESDDDYEILFTNATVLEMSLSDLQMLAQKYAPEGSAPTILSMDDTHASPRKGTTPEEILASLLEGDSSEDEEEEEGRSRRRSKGKQRGAAVMSLPAFRGTKELEPEENQDEESSSAEDEVSSSEDEKEESMPRPITASVASPKANQKRPGPGEEAELQRRANERRLAAVHQRQKEAEQNRRLIQGALSSLDSAPSGSRGKHIVFGSDDEDDENHKPEQPSANQSREQPSANQSKASSAPRLFNSDDEEEVEEEEESQRFEIRPEFEGAAGHKLMALQSRFGTDERFKMDARFLDDAKEEEESSECAAAEGSGQQEALQQEKQKNLSILQSVLGPGATMARPAGGSRAKAQTFRDVAALHYDPSNKQHSVFEKKLETHESKASRRKKREDAQKLPEVSKEMYFEVQADLKAVFGKEAGQHEEEEGQHEKEAGQQEKEAGQQERESNWDQEEEKEGRGDEGRGDEGRGDEGRGDEGRGDEGRGDEGRGDEEPEKEESGGFKFSFFGDEPDPEPEQTEYKVQSILAPKLSWQQNPRLNDSSDEEEEECGDEEEEERCDEEETAREKSSDLFFFSPNDPRLTDGVRWFCRTSLEEQRETWDQTRTELRQDCKKKHKDARRKLRVQR